MSVPPGSTIGIIGGGQLGRMLSMAAVQLGYRTHIYAPQPSGPAADASTRWTQGAYDDLPALAAFVGACDIVTYEFENLPVAALAQVGDALYPPVRALAVAQDRVTEKRFAQEQGVPVAPWRPVDDAAACADAVAAIGAPAILKTRRFGYDGKGQARIFSAADTVQAWAAIGGRPAVLERMIDFEAEFSILGCRTVEGEWLAWPAVTNVHVDGILRRSTVPPAGIVAEQAEAAETMARKIASALGYVGVMAAEFFAGADGPIFNEMAPRVHNSGHWTIEGAETSQFEQHIRAICGLPLGPVGLAGPSVEMGNLIGDEAAGWHAILARGDHLHLYGKGDPRPGRKMGHFTRVTRLG